MVDLSILSTVTPYHIITYGTLLGSQFYQSFIGGIVAYRTLERPHFSALQGRIFPIYFSLQAALPVILAITYPGARSASGVVSGPRGVFMEVNRWSVLVPMLTVFATGLVNLVFVGPATGRIMLERRHRETKDGKRCFDPPPHSKEMLRLNKDFGRMHGASSLLNMAALLATMWYGVTIAERLQ